MTITKGEDEGNVDNNHHDNSDNNELLLSLFTIISFFTMVQMFGIINAMVVLIYVQNRCTEGAYMINTMLECTEGDTASSFADIKIWIVTIGWCAVKVGIRVFSLGGSASESRVHRWQIIRCRVVARCQ